MNKTEDTKYPLVLHNEAMLSFYSQVQRPEQSLTDFSSKLKAKMEFLDGMGHRYVINVNSPHKEKLKEIFEENSGNDLLSKARTLKEKEKITRKVSKLCFGNLATGERDRNQHRKHQDQCHNSHMQGGNIYKLRMTEALNVMMNYCNSTKRHNPNSNPNRCILADDSHKTVNLSQTTPTPVRGKTENYIHTLNATSAARIVIIPIIVQRTVKKNLE